jgi:hypothetical protein
VLGTISDGKFEQVIADACDAVMSATRDVIRAVEIEQEGADCIETRAATARGGIPAAPTARLRRW